MGTRLAASVPAAPALDGPKPDERRHLSGDSVRCEALRRALPDCPNPRYATNGSTPLIWAQQRPDGVFNRDTQWHYRADKGFENHPAVEASWRGARDYCRWRGKRLPTEAEWERAARGTEGRPYPWGSQPPDKSRARYGSGWGQTVAVGSLPQGATPEGVMNMAGNVHEWVGSLFKPYPYRAKDGREHPNATGERVTRGGAADTGAETLGTTWRGANVSRNPLSGHHNIGFRCAKSVGR